MCDKDAHIRFVLIFHQDIDYHEVGELCSVFLGLQSQKVLFSIKFDFSVSPITVEEFQQPLIVPLFANKVDCTLRVARSLARENQP